MGVRLRAALRVTKGERRRGWKAGRLISFGVSFFLCGTAASVLADTLHLASQLLPEKPEAILQPLPETTSQLRPAGNRISAPAENHPRESSRGKRLPLPPVILRDGFVTAGNFI